MFICSDFIEKDSIEEFIKESNDKKVTNYDYDIICAISCQMNPEQNSARQKRHYYYANYVSESINSKPYVVFSNTKCAQYASGKSAIFFHSLGTCDRRRLCRNEELLMKYESLVSIMPDDSRYMLANFKIKDRVPLVGGRKVTERAQVRINYIDGISRYKDIDDHDIRLLACDLDGTLIQGPHHYSWVPIYEELGIPSEQRLKHKNAYLQKMNTSFKDYKKWCDANLADFKSKGLNKEILKTIANKHFSLTHNVKKTLEELKKRGVKIALISGGIDFFAKHLFGDDLRKYFEDRYINEFTYDGDDLLDEIKPTKYDFLGKAEAIDVLCSKYDISRRNVAFVGDARNDQQALSHAGLGIAFYPTPYTVCAQYVIQHEPDNELGDKKLEDKKLEDKKKLKDFSKILECIDAYKKNPRFY